MHNGLDKMHVIDSTALSGEHYFQSLLAQAHQKKLFSDSDIEQMQYACLTLLADKTARYNGGDNSSVRIEKAQCIMNSILFTIGVALKTYPTADDAVTALEQNPIDALYQKGRKRIGTLIAITKTMHTKLLRQLVDTQNAFYRDTFEGGILGFFKLYYPDYAAQEIHITADYPLYNPMPKLLGIEFIKAYVEAAYQENRFCGYFAAENIHHLLSGYAKDYRGLLINIYEQVLTAAIGCVIAGVDCARLDITETGAQYLYRVFAAQGKGEILAVLTKAADALNRRFQFPQALARYVQNSLPLLANSIAAAAGAHALNRIFFRPAFPENDPQILFSYGEKMDDAQYRKRIEEIRQCRYTQDKIAIIKRHIHSLADLEDVLLDAALTIEEIESILQALDLLEIAALSKRHPPMQDMDAVELQEQEQVLRMALQRYIVALPQKQQDLIVQASNALREAKQPT